MKTKHPYLWGGLSVLCAVSSIQGLIPTYAYTAPTTVNVSYTKNFLAVLTEIEAHVETAKSSAKSADYSLAIASFLSLNDWLEGKVLEKHEDYDQVDQTFIKLFNALDSLPKATARPLFQTWLDGLLEGEVANEAGYFDTFIAFIESESRDTQTIAYAKKMRLVHGFISRLPATTPMTIEEVLALNLDADPNPLTKNEEASHPSNEEWASQFEVEYADEDFSFTSTGSTSATAMTTYEYTYEEDTFGVCYEIVTEFTNGVQTNQAKRIPDSSKAHYCGDMTQFDWGQAKEVNESGVVNGGNKLPDTTNYLYYFVGEQYKQLSVVVPEDEQLSYSDYVKVLSTMTTDLKGTLLSSSDGAYLLIKGHLLFVSAYEDTRSLTELSQQLNQKLGLQLGTKSSGARF